MFTRTVTIALVLALICVAVGQAQAVPNLTPKNYQSKLMENEFMLVYVYSSSCGFCK